MGVRIKFIISSVSSPTNKNYWTLILSLLLTIKECSPPLGIQQKA